MTAVPDLAATATPDGPATVAPAPSPAAGAATLAIGSLCSGTGALEMGVQSVIGGAVAWHAEVDPDASKVLAHHWPGVPNHEDLLAVDWTTVQPVDVLLAGFPCQDLSYAGKGAGIQEGNRSGVWYGVARALGVLRPRVFIAENVSAIVTRRPGLDVVLADLARLGFDASWCCVRASDVGAPHQRNRWFLLAWPAGDTHRVARPLRGALDRGPAAVDQSEPVVRAVGPDRAPVPDTEDDRRERSRQPRNGRPGPADRGVPAPDTAGTGREGTRPEPERGGPERGGGAPAYPESDGRHEGRAEPARIGRGPDAPLGGHATAADADSAEQARERAEQPRGDAPAGSGESPLDWGRYGPSVARWEHVLGRRAPVPTEPGRGGQPRLSPAFVEWLMGLPAGHVTAVPDLSRNAQLRILGNGIVAAQAAYAVSLLLGYAEDAA